MTSPRAALRLPQPDPESLVLADGGARAVRRWGAPRPTDFLLLHGMESHSGWFEGVGRALAGRGLAAVAYDRRGWGASVGPRGRLDAPQEALRELARVRQAICANGPKPHLVGMSWGGLLALLAVQAEPAAYASLTLLVPAVCSRRKVGITAQLKAVLAIFPFLRDVLPLATMLPIDDCDFSQRAEALAFVGQDPLRVRSVHASFLFSTFLMQRMARETKHLALPASLLLAAEDALIDNAATAQFARERGVEVTTLPGTRHSLVLEVPDAVAEHLARKVLQ